MKPVDEIAWVKPWLAVWGGYEPAVRTDCHCAAVRLRKGWYVVDPLPLAKEALGELQAAAPIAGVVCLSGNHERNCLEWSDAWGCPLLAPPEAASAWGWANAEPLVPGVLDEQECEVFDLTGAGPCEMGLRIVRPETSWLMIADGLIHLEPEGLAVLPAKYCTDPRALRRSLESLLRRNFDGMTFGHGWPIPTGAQGRLKTLLQQN